MCDALFEFLQLLPLNDYIITKGLEKYHEVTDNQAQYS